VRENVSAEPTDEGVMDIVKTSSGRFTTTFSFKEKEAK
jgi:hypothetical protein